jgi:superfamily I DNA/RNA helicase
MTIHKSKGLEFDSVVVLGVEQEAFFGKIVDERAAFFVAISRAKRRLKLTWAKERARPSGNPYRWHTKRTPQAEFLGYSDGI